MRSNRYLAGIVGLASMTFAGGDARGIPLDGVPDKDMFGKPARYDNRQDPSASRPETGEGITISNSISPGLALTYLGLSVLVVYGASRGKLDNNESESQ